jgi:hypothetical protein
MSEYNLEALERWNVGTFASWKVESDEGRGWTEDGVPLATNFHELALSLGDGMRRCRGDRERG